MTPQKLFIVMTAFVLVLGAGRAHAQRDDTDERIRQLEEKVEALLEDNQSLRRKVGELEGYRPGGAMDTELQDAVDELRREMEGEIDKIYDRFPLSRLPGSDPLANTVEKMVWGGEWRTRADWRINTSDLTDEIDDEGLRLDYRFNLGVGFNLNYDRPEETDGASAPVIIKTWFEFQAAGRAANNTARSIESSLGVSVGNFSSRENDLDIVRLYQAYISLENILDVEGLKLTAGRQEIQYGTQLLMGTNEFFTGFVHDAVRFDFSLRGIEAKSVSLFYAKEAAPDGYAAQPFVTGGLTEGQIRGSGDEDELYGLYSTFTFLDPVNLDFYYFFFNGRGETEGIADVNVTLPIDPAVDALGRSFLSGRFHTIGFRADVDLDISDVRDLFLNLEFAYQFGDELDGDDIDAMIVEFAAEYKLPFLKDNNGRAYAGFYFAEGPDSDQTTGFSPLFISRHNMDPVYDGRGPYSRFGNIDLIPTQNVYVLQAGLKLEPFDKWTFGFTYLFAWLNHSREAISANAVGNFFVDDRALGHEIDIYAQKRIGTNTELFINMSLFFPVADLILNPVNPEGAASEIEVDSDVAFGLFAQIRVAF